MTDNCEYHKGVIEMLRARLENAETLLDRAGAEAIEKPLAYGPAIITLQFRTREQRHRRAVEGLPLDET